MRVLDRKVLRDLWLLRGQVLTIALMIGAGIGVLVASVSTWLSLVGEQRAYYAESRFAEVFAEVKRAPRALLPRIAEIPGVAAVEGRINGEARWTGLPPRPWYRPRCSRCPSRADSRR